MIRIKSYDATGIAPNGRLYAGDLNLLQDLVAALIDYTQNIGTSTLAIGDASLVLSKFGVGEIQISAAVRALGIIRATGGFVGGSYTTTARDAIAAGSRPFGLVILNTTTSQYEWNAGTDPAPSWISLGGGGYKEGLAAAKPAASVANAGQLYFETDTLGGTLFGSFASAWRKISRGITERDNSSGLYAARPAASAGINGTTYYATDQDALYMCVAAAWVRMGHQAGDIIWTAENTVRAGYLLLQGQAWPGTTGIYADLFAKWGGLYPTVLPDTQGRQFVAKGTHADVSTIGFVEPGGLAVGSRRVRHKHTHTLSISGGAHAHSDSGHTHSYNQIVGSPANIAAGGDFTGLTSSVGTGNANIQSNTHTHPNGEFAGVIGVNAGTEPTDGPAYITFQPMVKL